MKDYKPYPNSDLVHPSNWHKLSKREEIFQKIKEKFTLMFGKETTTELLYGLK